MTNTIRMAKKRENTIRRVFSDDLTAAPSMDYPKILGLREIAECESGHKPACVEGRRACIPFASHMAMPLIVECCEAQF